jgi:hypothetical protein
LDENFLQNLAHTFMEKPVYDPVRLLGSLRNSELEVQEKQESKGLPRLACVASFLTLPIVALV